MSPTGDEAGANVARWLDYHARRRPDQAAVIDARRARAPATVTTYAGLEALTAKVTADLDRAGLRSGERVVLMVEPSAEFLAAAFALFRLGAVLVGVDPGLGLAAVRRMLAEAAPSGFIGSAKAQIARAVLGWGEAEIRLSATVGRGPGARLLARLPGLPRLRPIPRAAAFAIEGPNEIGTEIGQLGEPRRSGTDAAARPLAAQRLAAVLYTSGSTGPPKGVEYTHAMFDAQLQALGRAFAIRPGEVELATFPLFALFAPALGLTAVIPRMDFTRPGRVDAQHLCALIASHRVTSLFGSPALLARLTALDPAPRFATLTRVVSAGAPVPARTIARVLEMLPEGGQVHTPYGATEALPVTSISGSEIVSQTGPQTARGAGVCVGHPVAATEVEILRLDDGPLDGWDPARTLGASEIGEIAVRGPVVSAGYFRRPRADRLAKVPDGRGGFYHRMGDVGYLDEQGRLWFCGRKSQRVPLPGGDLFTIPCEAVFNEHPAVARSALVGPRVGALVTPVLVVELHRRAGPGRRRGIRSELHAIAQAHPHTRAIQRFLFHPRFPVDARHNAKIGREQLTRWAGRRLR